MNTRAHEVTGLRSQKLEMEDNGAIYLAARGRISWRGVALQVDYAISDDMNFGGEFEGTQQDLEITLGYTLDSQRMTLFVGYQYSEFPGEGEERGLKYTSDFSLEGFYAGLTMIF